MAHRSLPGRKYRKGRDNGRSGGEVGSELFGGAWWFSRGNNHAERGCLLHCCCIYMASPGSRGLGVTGRGKKGELIHLNKIHAQGAESGGGDRGARATSITRGVSCGFRVRRPSPADCGCYRASGQDMSGEVTHG